MKLNKVGKKLKLNSKKDSLSNNDGKSESTDKSAMIPEPKSEITEPQLHPNKKNKRKFSKAFPAQDDIAESQVKIKNKAKSKKNKGKKANEGGNSASEIKVEPMNGENEQVPKKKKKKNKQKPTKPDSSENEVKSEPADNDVKIPKKNKKKLAAENKAPTDQKKSKINSTETPKKVSKPSDESKDSRDSRTVFVGNLPIKFNKKKLAKLFKKCGEIEKVWTRGVIPDDDKISKKVAFAKKLFHKDQLSLVAYILYKTAEDAQKALILNGELFDDHHLRVSISSDKSFDKNKGVFVGNLPFNVTDDEVWEMFKNCGEILTVRIIRDLKSGLGKGFGYVNFKSADAVELALKLNEEELQGRQIRVKRLLNEGKLKKLKTKKLLGNLKTSKVTGSKKPGKVTKAESDGSKSKAKIKKKKNKTDIKKKQLAAKLLAKPKKKKEKQLSSP